MSQGSRNFGLLAFGMGGSGDRERKWEEKFYLKMVFWPKIRLKTDLTLAIKG